MSEISKLGGNGIVRQAKRALIADISAGNAKKTAKKFSIGNGIIGASNGGLCIINAAQGNTATAVFNGIASAFCSTAAGLYIKDLIKATKTKKQTSQALKDIITRQDFMDIVNRFRRINGNKERTPEQFINAYNRTMSKV